MLGRLLVSLVLLSALGCPSKKEIEASIWLNDGLPLALCEQYPDLAKYGVYRQLNNGSQEFMSYCNPLVKDWLGIHKADFEKFVKATWPDVPTDIP